MKKFAMVFILFFVLTGCQPDLRSTASILTTESTMFLSSDIESTTSNNTDNRKDYGIQTIEKTIKGYNNQDFTFYCIQAIRLPRGIIAINLWDDASENLELASSLWLSKTKLKLSTEFPTITCHSFRYLSVRNRFFFGDKKVSSINNCVTIDMQTGKRVMLDDLVDAGNPEFINYLRFGRYLASSAEEFDTPPETVQEWLTEHSDHEIIAMLDEASTDLSYFISEESVNSESGRTTFNVEEGRLTIVFGGSNFAILDLNDIEQFLKVPKW